MVAPCGRGTLTPHAPPFALQAPRRLALILPLVAAPLRAKTVAIRTPDASQAEAIEGMWFVRWLAPALDELELRIG